jgi:dihydroorotase
LHLRDGAALAAVLPDTARRFARAIVMPNLKPPVTTVALAAAYRERILAALPAGMNFAPLMTLYLTDNMPAAKSMPPRPAASSMRSSFIRPAPPPIRMPASAT